MGNLDCGRDFSHQKYYISGRGINGIVCLWFQYVYSSKPMKTWRIGSDVQPLTSKAHSYMSGLFNSCP